MTQKTLGTATVSGGIAQTSYTIPSDELVGDFTMTGTYTQNDHYKEATDTADFKVRIGTSITVDNVTGNTGESATFTAHVLHGGNTAVNEGQVQFTLEGTIIGTANVSNGVATLAYTLPGTVSDGDSISANYLGTSTYGTSATSSSATLHIRGAVTVTVDAVITTRNATATLSCIVEDSNGDPITDTTVDFYIDNVLIGTDSTADSTTHKYEYSYSVPSNAVAGTHTIKCVSSQTADNVSAEGTGNLTVRMPTHIVMDDVSCNLGGNVTLTGHVYDENNTIVTSGVGTFEYEGDFIEVSGNPARCDVGNDGSFTLTISLSSLFPNASEGSTYSLNAGYIANNNYVGSVSNSATLTVRKTPVLIVSDVTANRGDTVYLSTSVTYGGNNVTEGSVTFTLEQT